ncbi:mercury transporter MerT [Marinihelvus fidelis]|uniref:Mercuric transport protein MerT n=2 Tax=Marinihelvus fidelis TaxID=2613842 RepID=A0A5N0TH21_9GAMM|nr:mercury transporter MerT [Marinihelvus fidelis]
MATNRLVVQPLKLENAMVDRSKQSRQATAFASVAGALLASSCCVLPLVLVSLGISGAWIGTLKVLEPYKFLIALFTGGFLVAGFWLVYGKATDECEEECRTPVRDRLVKITLWAAACLVIISLTVNIWAPYFY